MQKRLIFLLFFILSAVSSSAIDADKLNQALQEKQQEIITSFPSNFSKEEGVLPLTIKTKYVKVIEDIDMSGKTASFTRQESYHCPAVKIYNNWLAVSAPCVRAVKGSYDTFRLDGTTISDSQIIGLDNYTTSVMLIFVPHKNDSKLTKTLNAMPQANIMVLSPNASAEDVAKLQNSFYINRQRLSGFGRTTAEVQPDLTCKQEYCTLTLENKFINGDFGDPLFSVTENGQEFLLGFNNSNGGITGHSGKKYTLLNNKDLSFLQDSILSVTPDIWKDVKRKIVDEKFLATH